MADNVFVNGRAVVHKGSSGQSVAFPDVCLCPPGPPAGPIPVPLTNTVVAADMEGGAQTVLISGNPGGTRQSYFKRSTGNEVSRPTGGGVLTAAVQGKAHFRFGHSFNTFYEGQPVVRHLDPLTHNHLAFPGNTPPAPWLSTMDPALPGRAPQQVAKQAREGDDWIAIKIFDEAEQTVATRYRLKTAKGRIIEGRTLAGGQLTLRGIAKGRCELLLPDVDGAASRVKRTDAPRGEGARRGYQPRTAIALDTGKSHEVLVPAMVSLWVDLPIRARDAATRDDRFILRSKDGKYEAVRTVQDDRVKGDEGLTLEFPGLRPGQQYTLLHDTGSEGFVYSFFEERPFEELFPRKPPAPRSDEEGRQRPAASDELARYNADEYVDDGELPDLSDE